MFKANFLAIWALFGDFLLRAQVTWAVKALQVRVTEPLHDQVTSPGRVKFLQVQVTPPGPVKFLQAQVTFITWTCSDFYGPLWLSRNCMVIFLLQRGVFNKH